MVVIMWQEIQRNWKTNLVSLIAFLYTIPQVVTCIQTWAGGGKCNWQQTVLGLLVAVGAWAAKDSTNHSTAEEVTQATKKEL